MTGNRGGGMEEEGREEGMVGRKRREWWEGRGDRRTGR